MLTIQNIYKLEYVMTPEWKVWDVMDTGAAYIIQIKKNFGEWQIRGDSIDQMTMYLRRNRDDGCGGYIMSSGFVRSALVYQSVVSKETLSSLNTFVHYGIQNQINNILKSV